MFPKTASLPYQWHLDGNYLMGITLDRGWSLLKQNQFRLTSAYWHRVVAILLTSGLSTLLSQVESWRYGHRVDAAELPEDPIFILGHWRSGTTFLHELLALDTDQLAYANTFQVMSPQTFLLTEDFCQRWFARLVPSHRPMDNMHLSFDSPQEDEFAIALTTLQSYYLALSFPQAEAYYERYLTLQDLSPAELQQWQTAFLRFLKKLTLKYRCPLVLKSPPHTARIRLLLELFPRARFVHIHRHPYAVFQSMRHYFDTAGWFTCLQKPNLQVRDRAILRRYRTLYEAYFAQQPLIPTGQFHEVSFSALEADPITQMQRLYQALKLSYSQELDAKLHCYVTARQDYRKNAFPSLETSIQQQINREWRFAFDTWGYAMG
ncbi:MAG: sulfotransferase [Leptolyngbya sp. SIO1D8]|nr:sulfotransferase [Leptolyngbya sp. SIO1D8]